MRNLLKRGIVSFVISLLFCGYSYAQSDESLQETSISWPFWWPQVNNPITYSYTDADGNISTYIVTYTNFTPGVSEAPILTVVGPSLPPITTLLPITTVTYTNFTPLSEATPPLVTLFGGSPSSAPQATLQSFIPQVPPMITTVTTTTTPPSDEPQAISSLVELLSANPNPDLINITTLGVPVPLFGFGPDGSFTQIGTVTTTINNGIITTTTVYPSDEPQAIISLVDLLPQNTPVVQSSTLQQLVPSVITQVPQSFVINSVLGVQPSSSLPQVPQGVSLSGEAPPAVAPPANPAE